MCWTELKTPEMLSLMIDLNLVWLSPNTAFHSCSQHHAVKKLLEVKPSGRFSWKWSWNRKGEGKIMVQNTGETWKKARSCNRHTLKMRTLPALQPRTWRSPPSGSWRTLQAAEERLQVNLLSGVDGSAVSVLKQIRWFWEVETPLKCLWVWEMSNGSRVF